MTRTFALLLLVGVLTTPFSSCADAGGQADLRPGKSIDSAKDSKRIEIKVNIEGERKLQTAVDRGHQPWRLDPIDTAHAALVEIDETVSYDTCGVVSETDVEARVECRGKSRYVVVLKRLVKPKGIWTATTIEIQ
jgi:hypothetical protein